MLIACSSSNSDKIDKALDKIEKAIEDKKIEKADELLDEFDDRFEAEELSESQAIRRQCIMIAIVESYSNYDYEQEAAAKTKSEAEKYFSYKVLYSCGPSGFSSIGDYCSFGGLAILYGNDNNMNYIMFDDEENYDDDIYEWYLAYKMAENLWNLNLFCREGDAKLKEQKIYSYLKYITCMPDCLNQYVTDDIAKESFRKTYYDERDVELYEPTRGYGYRKYPYTHPGSSSYGAIRLKRIDDNNYGVPKGILCIF